MINGDGMIEKVMSSSSETEQVTQLAEDWRTRYIRRRAMMEELRNAGF